MGTETQVFHEGGLVQEDEMVTVGDLGTFSMKEIYHALSSSITEPRAIPPPEMIGYDSDCSWTVDEECGEFYIQMRRRLDDFTLASTETTMTTDALSRHERRFVHATAQVLSLGHASLGPPHSRERRMLIYKTCCGTIPEVTQDPQSKGISRGCFEDMDITPTAAPSMFSSASQRKRKRLEKLNGGYPCQYHPCGKTFDRASERNKHEQAHQPAFTNRYQCNICNKGFRYPKDLRRHTTRVHEGGASRPIFDPSYASLGSTAFSSSLTYESRLPSETSLNFTSNPVSKNSSPLLLGRSKSVEEAQVGIEEFMLDGAGEVLPSWFLHEPLQLVGNVDLRFPEQVDFDFDEHDLGDEDVLLEMARVKR